MTEEDEELSEAVGRYLKAMSDAIDKFKKDLTVALNDAAGKLEKANKVENNGG